MTIYISTGGYSNLSADQSSKKLIEDAQELESAGAFCIVLEMVTKEISKLITESISIPTIGIGSGSDCDGQILVLHDMLNLYDSIKPSFVKQYADINFKPSLSLAIIFAKYFLSI